MSSRQIFGKSSAQTRIKALLPTLSHIQKLTGTPGISFGVLHEGEVIFTHGHGYRDSERKDLVDANTMFLLGSLTKGFIAACCGILVQEGKLSWKTPLSSYIPFKTLHDPIVGERANLNDALSHSTGLAQLDLSWYGADGETILDKDSLIHVISNLPSATEFRGDFHYCNYMYALVGRIIELVGGLDAANGWGGYLRKRIFDPLKMHRSFTNRADLPDMNFAEPHTVLDNGTAKPLAVPETSDQSTLGAAGAVWSTASDMLIWTKAILDSLELEQSGHQDSVLKKISEIVSHKSYLTDNATHENTYASGWARAEMPSPQLGFLSINGAQRENILGRDSPPRLVLYHGGQITGYLSSIYMFPDTKSAVVVLANAQGLGDGSDWTAQAIVQSLFDLQPKLNHTQLAMEKRNEQLKSYDKIMEAYEQHRRPDTKQPHAKEFIGTYINKDICMHIDILARKNDDGIAPLEMRINQRDSQRHRLRHYNDDSFGFPPASREEMETRCLVDYSEWNQFILDFQRTNGQVSSLKWKMQPGVRSLSFVRNTSEA